MQEYTKLGRAFFNTEGVAVHFANAMPLSCGAYVGKCTKRNGSFGHVVFWFKE